MSFPELKPNAVRYHPDETVEQLRGPVVTTDVEDSAMSLALSLAAVSLQNGNPPVGAVLINNATGKTWANRTDDKTTRNLVRHGEMVAYFDAQPEVGDDLSDCTLVTTAELCSSCTPHYAEGRIGKIIYAAPRAYVFPLTNIMRPRNINMPDLLKDGNTDTTVIENYRMIESLGLFATYGALKGVRVPKKAGKFLLGISRGTITPEPVARQVIAAPNLQAA